LEYPGEKSNSLNPNYAHGLCDLGGVLSFAGKPKEAIEVIERALRLDPFFPYHFFFLGHAHFLMRNYEYALAALRADAIDILVTEDIGIRRKARRLGLDGRVLTIKETMETLASLAERPGAPPPAVVPSAMPYEQMIRSGKASGKTMSDSITGSRAAGESIAKAGIFLVLRGISRQSAS
jgi:hypothetical protein